MLRAAPRVWGTALSVETAMKYPVSRFPKYGLEDGLLIRGKHTSACSFFYGEVGLFC